MKFRVPVYRHPTQFVFIDPRPVFVESIKFCLLRGGDAGGKAIGAFTGFTKASEATSWIADSLRAPCPPCFKVGDTTRNFRIDGLRIRRSVDDILKIAADPARFQTLSVVVVELESMQSGALSSWDVLSGSDIKTVLTSTSPNYEAAFEAFNSHGIRKYLVKDREDFIEKLESTLFELQEEYFLDRSDEFTFLRSDAFGFLEDRAFATLVDLIYKRYGFVEHYLSFDPPGLCFFDAAGLGSLLVVKTESRLFEEVSDIESSAAPADIVAKVNKLELMYCGKTPQNGFDEWELSWSELLKPPSICTGRGTYFWTMTDVLPELVHVQPFPFAQVRAGNLDGSGTAHGVG